MKYVWMGLMALVASGASAIVHAQTNIAFVNTQRVLEQAPQAKAASERLQQEFAPRESTIAAAQKTLKELQEKRERDGAVMSEVERSRLDREIVSQQRDLKRDQSDYTEDLALRRRDEFARFQRETAEAITAIAKENSYDLVLEAGVVYASDKVDVTDMVLARLRDRFNQQAQKGKK